MLELSTPRGLPVRVPESVAEGPTERFRSDQVEQIRAYYEQNGYVVVSSVIPADVCETMRGLWERDVKPSGDFMYRQATAKAERHTFNANRWVMNPILNLQSVDPRNYGKFRDFATQQILSNPRLTAVFTELLHDQPKIVQSMYFEGNSATWEHQDTYYLDSEELGTMAGAWIALETIEASAGRFFIAPRSHLIELDRHSADNNLAEHHDVYIESVVKKMVSLELEIRAPKLETGDVLFWNSRTIHGSLDSQDANHSRSSITCHAIARSNRFMQMQLRVMDLPTDQVNGVDIYRPKDLAKLRNRAILWAESTFPKRFYSLKRFAMRRIAKRGGH